MSGKKLFAVVLMFFTVIHSLFAFQIDFSDSEVYGANGVPKGWKLDKGQYVPYVYPYKNQPQAPSGSDDSGLYVTFYGAEDENLLYCTDTIKDELICDTVLANLRIYSEPGFADKIDAFQVVVSTNGWVSYEKVGNPIPIKEKKWETYKRSVHLAGLVENQPGVSVGIRMIPAGESHAFAYVKSLDVQIAAAATPKNVSLSCNGVDVDEKINPLLPGDSNVVMRVCVTPDPRDMELQGVYGVVDRNGIVTTNLLERVKGTDEYTNSILKTVLDAGEVLRISAFSKYKSDLPMAGDVHDDGYAYEDLDVPVQYVVGKSGSVWINELTAERVEICGTTNRVLTSGWTLVVSDNNGKKLCFAELGDAFGFENMINGIVGIEVRDLLWVGEFPLDSDMYSVSLCNSMGVAEHMVQMRFSKGAIMGQTGFARWPDAGYGYDWTGTATDGTFVWGELLKSSFGEVNAGQGFNVPVSVNLEVNTVISYATVIATVSNINNSTVLGTTVDFPAVSVDGVASLTITGCTPFPNEIHIVLSGMAFGWTSDRKGIVLRAPYDTPETDSLIFIPTIAYDDFSTFASYWSNIGELKWSVSEITRDGGPEKVLRLNTFSADAASGFLKCQNYLSAYGRRMCAVAFDYCNTVNGYEGYDEFSVLISTNAEFKGVVKSTPLLSNKRSSHKDEEWYRYQATFELPKDFSDASELWLGLECISRGDTHTFTYVDNLRVAFQDVALPTNLTRTVETPMSGGSTGFVLDVLPQTTDEIEEVSADLHITVNGVKKIVPFAFADGTLTNAMPLVKGEDGEAQAVQLSITPEALEKALGTRFYAGDSVTYYAAVHYNSANGDTDPEGVYETRYFPDNSTIDSEERWIVEGEYKAIVDKLGFTVDGPDIEILGEPRIGADEIEFDYHAWDRNKGKGITNLALMVEADGFSTNYVMFAGDATNRVTDAFVVPDLVANTTYKLTLSGQRNTGYDLTSTNYTFTTLGEVKTAKIVGTSPSGVELTVDGLAEKYAVEPSDWVQKSGSATVWTWEGGSPNTVRTATIKAVNSAGMTNEAAFVVSGYTLAANPNVAPVVTNIDNVAVVWAEDPMVSDGNPTNTEYAVRVRTSRGADSAYISDDNGVIWKTLADWAEGPVTNGAPIIDLIATNYFRFVARNTQEHAETENKGPESKCWFDMTAGFIDNAAYQAKWPFADGFVAGYVAFTNVFFEPATSKQAKVEFAYQLGDEIDETAWIPLDEPSDLIDFNELCVTNGYVWNARASVKDDVKTGYFLRATVSKDDRSASAVIGGTLDFEKPTVELSSKTHRSPFNTAPLKVDVAFSEDVVGFTKNAVKVGNGTVTAVVTNNASSYTVDIEPAGQGARVLDISVWVEAGAVTDVYGNANVASKEPKPTWTYDTDPPTVTLTSETLKPFNASESPWEVQVDFSEPVVGFDTNKVKVTKGQATEVVQNNPTNYTVKVAPTAEGDVVVQIEAGKVTDAAGNGNVASGELTRIYDNTPPVLGELTGWPTAWTNTTEFSFTISAEDNLTPFTYHWTMGEVEVSNATNYTDNVPGEGTYTLSVYATDAAGNVSVKTNSVTWSVDKTPPSDPEIVDKPNVVTREPAYSFTAVAEDDMKQPVVFCWNLDGADGVRTLPADVPFSGKFADDGSDDKEHVVKVYTVDAAGNHSKGTTIYRWTLDTTAPVLDEITGTPAEGAVTNGVEYSFSIALKKEDLTDVTFHWLTNGVWAADVANFSDMVAGPIKTEGEKIASVYATDAAGNVSMTNSRIWTVDWTAPKMPDIDGEPTNGSITNLTWFNLSATVMDNLTTPTFRWSFDGGEVQSLATNMPFASSGMQDGDHTVLCYAVDEAFNVSETNFWRWTVDTTVPTNFVLVGTPGDGDVTTSTNFDFKASAMDSTKLTYHWTLTGKEWGNTSSNYAGVVSEGTNWVSVFARDAVGNVCDPTGRTWIVDYTPPMLDGIDGKPAKLTNKPDFTMTAVATDKWTTMTYHWTFNDKVCDDVKGAMFSSKVHPAVEGTNAVSVYVTDEAKNVSATNSYEWVLDTTPPTVTLESKTPSPFNTAMAPMVVTVKFSESVPDFTQDSVGLEIENGKIQKFETVVQNREYKLSINPFGFGEKGVWTNVTVRIMKGAVHDDAGNENEKTVSMTKTYDTRCPIVTLSADDTPDFFNTSPMKVTVEFSEEKVDYACVYGFTRDSVVVTNCEVTAIEETKTNNTYVLTVRPLGDGLVTVVVPDDVVTNRIGNYNAASQPLMKTYDATEPKDLTILGTPTNKAVTAVKEYLFKASAKDTTELKFTWQLINGKTLVSEQEGVSSNYVFKGEAPKGTNTVTVFAVDQAGNQCATVTNTWIYDFEPPTMPTVSGGPGKTNEDEVVVTTELDFDYVAHAVDEYTRVTYHWLTNGVVVAENPTNFVGSVAEGTNTVEVYATDEADNISGTNAVVWVVDRTPPTLLGWSGLPEKFTTATNLSLTATASDNLTRVAYHWTFDTDKEERTEDGEAFVRTGLADGEHTVSVYATDEADNVSTTTNSWTWTVDTHAPTNLVVVGEPADGSVTSNRVFGFEVSSEDLTDVRYSWKLSDGQEALGDEFAGTVEGADGVYSVSVIATDMAGNESTTNWTWTLDTIAPTNLTLRGLPIADDPKKVIVTNGYFFAFTASAGDATAITYHWATNGVAVTDCTVSNFVGYVSEGTNTVSVYAMDAASNVCESIERKWVVDTKGPSRPEIDGKPTDKSVTNNCEFDFTASASDDWSAITFHWSLTDGRTAEGPTFKDKFKDDGKDDGSYTVSVWAIDEAGNSSETNSLSWTLDTIAPKMPVIVDASPASNLFVNVANYNFTAAEPEGEEDATAVKFFWRIEGGDLDGKKEDPVTNFTGEVGKDGAYTAFVYAKDAAGNISTTNNLSWTVDTQIPTNLVISGWPVNGSLTNGANYRLTAEADDATELTFHWTISDAAGVSDLSKDEPFEGEVADGTHTVSCYATDAAGNPSATKFWSWTSDTTGPTNLVLSIGTPTEGAVVATNGYDFTASAMDLTKIAYCWTLNGNKSENTTSNFVGTAAREGTNTLSVTATDAAGNPSEETLTRTWVVDTFAPTNLVVTGTPGDGALTNGTFFSWTASAQDATRLTYHWCLLTNGVEAVTGIETNEFSDVAVEGTNTVTVYAKDEAGNVSAATNVCWMVDLTPPTVELLPEILTNKWINLADLTPNGFKVVVDFNKPVTGFTAASVTVANGTVTLVETNDNGVASYAVWVKPSEDYEGDEFTVEVKADAVKDLAGNGNKASETLRYRCDVKRPSVTLTTETPDPFGRSYLLSLHFVVTVAFSEQVTNFTASSVIVTNGTVSAVTEKEDKKVFEVTILPTRYQFDVAEIVSVQVGEGVVADLAGNRNVASEPLTRKYDHAKPTKPVITGTPTNDEVTAVAQVNLFARSEDMSKVSYYWYVDGVEQKEEGTNLVFTVVEEREYVVEVFAEDAFGLQSGRASMKWTYKTGTKPSGMDFGGGITLPVSPDYVTNDVSFTAVDFRPGEGEESTFALRDFELNGSQTATAEIWDLKMWFIVGTNVLDYVQKRTRHVKVNEKADFDNGTLTVTIPGEEMTDETGKPFESFFIFGVDNKEK